MRKIKSIFEVVFIATLTIALNLKFTSPLFWLLMISYGVIVAIADEEKEV